jgi:hypothetical protein
MNTNTERMCKQYAELARQACGTLDNIAPHTGDGRCARMRAWVTLAQDCERNIVSLANRIIALRTNEARQQVAGEVREPFAHYRPAGDYPIQRELMAQDNCPLCGQRRDGNPCGCDPLACPSHIA